MRILGPVAESNALYRPPPATEITIVSSFGLNSASPSFVPQNLGAQAGDVIVWIYAMNESFNPTRTMKVNNSSTLEYDTQFANVSPYTSISYGTTLGYISDTSGDDAGNIGARIQAHTIVDPTHTIEARVASGSYADPAVAGVILRGHRPGGYYPSCFSPQIDSQLTGKRAASGWVSTFDPYPRLPAGTITNPPSADAIAENYGGPQLALNLVATLSTPGSSLQPPAGWTKIVDKTSLVDGGASWDGIVTVAIAYRVLPLDGDTSWPEAEWSSNVYGNNISFVKAVELAAAGTWTRDDE
jgi:hypothetical protein